MIVDTTNKTIQVQTETLGEVVGQLQKMFPDEWKEYRLLTTTVNPTIIQKEVIREVHPYREIPYVPYVPTTDPYYDPWRITYMDMSRIISTNNLAGSGWKYGIDSQPEA